MQWFVYKLFPPPRLRPVSYLSSILKRVVSARKHWKVRVVEARPHSRAFSHTRDNFLLSALSLTGKERKTVPRSTKPWSFYSIFVLHRYPAKAEDMQSWPWKATETHRIAWATVNAVTTCFLILAVAIRVTLTSNYAYRSQCHAQHITATSDEVRLVLWETKTIITFISGNSLLSVRSR